MVLHNNSFIAQPIFLSIQYINKKKIIQKKKEEGIHTQRPLIMFEKVGFVVRKTRTDVEINNKRTYPVAVESFSDKVIY